MVIRMMRTSEPAALSTCGGDDGSRAHIQPLDMHVRQDLEDHREESRATKSSR
jgi:hypothetical protein